MTIKLIAIGGLGNMLSPSAEHLQPEIAQYVRVLDRGRPGELRDKRRQAWRTHGAALVGSLLELVGEGDFDGVVICAGKNGDDYRLFQELLPLLRKFQPQRSHFIDVTLHDGVSKGEKCEFSPLVDSCEFTSQESKFLQGNTPCVSAGYFILHLSTVSCDFVQATAAACQQQGVQYANYPLTGGVLGAQNAQMLILASGDQALYQRLEPMLKAIGVPQYFGEEVSLGAAVKLMGHVMLFHGLLGISLAAVLHKNVMGFADLCPEQVGFFDFLNKGAGGTRQWDVALRQSLLEQQWQKGFALPYAVIDAIYAVNLLMEKNLPRLLILPLLEVILLFCWILQKESEDLATQAIAHLLARENSAAIDAFLGENLSWDVQKSLQNCVAALPESLREILMLEVRY